MSRPLGAVRAAVPASARRLLACMISVHALLGGSGAAHAMSLEQMGSLAGTSLLDLRVDRIFQRCGLPAAIADTGRSARARRAIRWNHVQMELSPLAWELVYTRRRASANHDGGWTNPDPGGAACLSGLSTMILQAKGEAGLLTVKKRPDNKGYVTTYRVPDDLYAAHQVTALTGSWTQGVPLPSISERYGTPDEIRDEGAPGKSYRYWVIARQQGMPISVHAVDFMVNTRGDLCTGYRVYTSGVGFVQERLDALRRQWLRDFVLD